MFWAKSSQTSTRYDDNHTSYGTQLPSFEQSKNNRIMDSRNLYAQDAEYFQRDIFWRSMCLVASTVHSRSPMLAMFLLVLLFTSRTTSRRLIAVIACNLGSTRLTTVAASYLAPWRDHGTSTGKSGAFKYFYAGSTLYGWLALH